MTNKIFTTYDTFRKSSLISVTGLSNIFSGLKYSEVSGMKMKYFHTGSQIYNHIDRTITQYIKYTQRICNKKICIQCIIKYIYIYNVDKIHDTAYKTI